MHPELASAHINAWTQKQIRTDTRLAEIKFYLAQPHSKKRLKVSHFIPEYAKQDQEDDWVEREMKAAQQALKNGI